MDRGKKPTKLLTARNSKLYMDLKDIIREHALAFLPAKSLFRCQGVCRDWKLQIATPFFAHNQSLSFHGLSGLFYQTPGNPPSFISIDPKSCGVPDPLLKFLPVPVDIRTSSSGLLCCQGRTGDKAYCICNPVTQQWKILPKPNAIHGPDPAVVLVFEPSLLNFVAEYKLVFAFPSADFDGATEFEVYSSKDGTWRVSGEICFADKKLIPRSGVHVKGILREDMLAREPNSVSRQSVSGCTISDSRTDLKNSGGWSEQYEIPSEISNGKEQSSSKVCIVKKPYQFLHIWILREYLELDLAIRDPPEKFKPDFERIIDDFIFMCFLIGNDFLPHMPTLEIHEHAVDLLMHVYKTEFKNFGGYLVDMQRVEDKKGGFIKLKRVEKFVLVVGSFEEKIFKKRSDLRERKIRQILSKDEDARGDEDQDLGINELSIDSTILPVSEICSHESHTSASEISLSTANNPEILRNTKEFKEKLKQYARKASDVFKNGCFGTDKIRLTAPGHKDRYYKEKFSSDDIESTRKVVVEKYTEGLCWVLLYYFAGVPSWTWFYPYHYGPFASDLKGLAQVKPKFQKGLPLKPFDQLMGVIPPRSAHSLPPAYQHLMAAEDSSIIDFYPKDFEVDVDGKLYIWQGICKLPFIEEARLLAETGKLESELKGDEVIRNSESLDQLFLGRSNKLASQSTSLHKNHECVEQNDAVKIEAIFSGDINDENAVDFAGNREAICDNSVLCVFYKVLPSKMHIPRLLEGVTLPEKTISEADIGETQLWHEYQSSRTNSGRMQNPNGNWKMRNNINSSNSPPVVIMKGAGTGWGRGRGGRLIADKNGIKTSFVAGEMVKTPYFPFKMGHGIPENNVTSPMNRGMYNSNEKWKSSGFGRGGSQGIDEIKSYGRANPTNNVWQTRSSIASTSNQVWRQTERQSSNAAISTWSQHVRGPSSQAYSPRCPNQSSNATIPTWSQHVRGPSGQACSPWRPNQSSNAAVSTWSQHVRGPSSQAYSPRCPNQSSNATLPTWRQHQHVRGPSSQACSPWRPNQSSNAAVSTWSQHVRGQHETHNSYMAAVRWNSSYSDAASGERTGPR